MHQAKQHILLILLWCRLLLHKLRDQPWHKASHQCHHFFHQMEQFIQAKLTQGEPVNQEPLQCTLSPECPNLPQETSPKPPSVSSRGIFFSSPTSELPDRTPRGGFFRLLYSHSPSLARRSMSSALGSRFNLVDAQGSVQGSSLKPQAASKLSRQILLSMPTGTQHNTWLECRFTLKRSSSRNNDCPMKIPSPEMTYVQLAR